MLLETDRLILRMWRNEDFAAYEKMCADPEIMKYLGGRTFDRLEAWRHMAFLVGHWQLLGFGHWAVEEKESGKFIGRLGFLNPEGWPGFEIGWTLAREAWGKGYATEAAAACLDYGFEKLRFRDVYSFTSVLNKSSERVMQKIGMEKEGEFDHPKIEQGHPLRRHVLYRVGKTV